MNYQQAADLAVNICHRLAPYTTRLNIAGSIRRKKPEVKDIEIVCQPVLVNADLFGESGEKVVSPDFCEAVKIIGQAHKGKPTGRYMQFDAHPVWMIDIKVDLFMPQAHDYYRQLAIRTGSARYSFEVIAKGWVEKGWVGTDEGLRLRQECLGTHTDKGKVVWSCINKNPTLPPVWTSEEEFFDWIGVPWVHPTQRNL